MKRFCLVVIVVLGIGMSHAHANPPARSKFYDFSEQLIDGEIKRPTTLYTDSRQRVKFDRLLRLKKSFIPELFKTAKERVFR
jgi:hypothetical protein